MTKVKGNDFSKIQGRFDTRLSLSSANVDAVIKKRILEKNETAAQTLRLLFGQKATIIKNLIVSMMVLRRNCTRMKKTSPAFIRLCLTSLICWQVC